MLTYCTYIHTYMPRYWGETGPMGLQSWLARILGVALEEPLVLGSTRHDNVFFIAWSPPLPIRTTRLSWIGVCEEKKNRRLDGAGHDSALRTMVRAKGRMVM